MFPTYDHLPLTPITCTVGNNIQFPAIAWALKPDILSNAAYDRNGELMYVSIVDRYPLARAAWAAMLDVKKAAITLRSPWPGQNPNNIYYRYCTAHRADGKQQYRAFWNPTPLPIAGSYANLVLLHASYFEANSGSLGFFHLSIDNRRPQLDLFYAQLDRALVLPLQPAWKELLWERGISQGIIHSLTTHNCTAWWVEANSQELQWAAITTSLYAPGKMLSTETYGPPLVAPADTEVEEDVDDDIGGD
jgi:hypothetical protein